MTIEEAKALLLKQKTDSPTRFNDAIDLLVAAVPEWISVDDSLPIRERQMCWVWSEDWRDSGETPTDDFWMDDRGEKCKWHNSEHDERDEFTSSGWYETTGVNITHWMPIVVPKPPKKVERSNT